MSQQYITSDGDMLDEICQNYYGGTSGFVEQVYAENPNLSEIPFPFKSGILITLPDIAPAPQPQLIQLFD